MGKKSKNDNYLYVITEKKYSVCDGEDGIKGRSQRLHDEVNNIVEMLKCGEDMLRGEFIELFFPLDEKFMEVQLSSGVEETRIAFDNMIKELKSVGRFKIGIKKIFRVVKVQ